jgi:AcrR family transcriptional regulator
VETQERMLDAAVAMVTETGLTVSLEHISLEDVIHRAGVSRSAVYRRWPYKDLFFSDLLKRLAAGASPAIGGTNPEAVAAVNKIVLDHLDWLRTPKLRRALAAEVLRQGALDEFETFHASAEWRTYYALQATFLSLPDGELRREVQDALTASERVLITRVARAYEEMTNLLGLRIRPELEITFDTIAVMATATTRGMVLMAPANPGIASQRFQANPFGAPEPAEWSEPALSMVGVTLTFLEPDPSFRWTDERAAAVREALTTSAWARA